MINNFMSLGVDRQFRYIAIKNVYPGNEIDPELVLWLDIGTGTGHLANELHRQKKGTFVIGLDVSLSMIEYTKQRNIYQDGCMNIVLGDASKTPFRNRSFGGGFSGFVGRHFTDYPTTLKEHNRVLKHNGRLMMLEMGRKATPLAFIVDFYVGKVMSTFGKLAAFLLTKGTAPFRLLENTYAVFYSPKELVSLYEGAGFQTWHKLVLFGSIVIILAHKV